MGLLSWFRSLFTKKPTTKNLDANDKALVIGINAYPGAPLNGCVNDATNVRDYLLSIGFKAENIRVLTDRSATTAAILDSLNWLTSISSGCRCYFHYSGHGAQVPNNKDEPDGLSEVICPVDFDWTMSNMITDKQFVAILQKIPTGVLFNWSSDSCHSGDLDRGFSKPKVKNHPRHYPTPPHIHDLIQRIKFKNHEHRHLREMIGGRINVGYLSGCKSDQTSADTEMQGKPCGAFTYFFLDALKTLPVDSPLTEICQKIRMGLSSNGYEQIPQVDGPRKDKPFLR